MQVSRKIKKFTDQIAGHLKAFHHFSILMIPFDSAGFNSLGFKTWFEFEKNQTSLNQISDIIK